MKLVTVITTIILTIALQFVVVQTLSVVTLHRTALSETILFIASVRALRFIIATHLQVNAVQLVFAQPLLTGALDEDILWELSEREE